MSEILTKRTDCNKSPPKPPNILINSATDRKSRRRTKNKDTTRAASSRDSEGCHEFSPLKRTGCNKSSSDGSSFDSSLHRQTPKMVPTHQEQGYNKSSFFKRLKRVPPQPLTTHRLQQVFLGRLLLRLVFTSINAEDGADRHIRIDVRRAVERVEHATVAAAVLARHDDDLLVLLGCHDSALRDHS